MTYAIVTTTGFHLRHLAREWAEMEVPILYRSYAPPFRLARQGIPNPRASSYFAQTLPLSALAQLRLLGRYQTWFVDRMLKDSDEYLSRHLRPCRALVGLSAMSIATAEAARRQGAKLVIADRGSSHVLHQANILTQSGAAMRASYIERELRSYELADYVAVPSQFALRSFLEQGYPSDRIFVNPYGVDLSTFDVRHDVSRTRDVVFVGQWSLRKGCDVLTRAIAAMPTLTFTHVGSVVDTPLPVSRNFTSYGYVPHERLNQVLQQHRVLALPSREDGFGMVLLEALAAGLTLVASTATGGPDVRDSLEDPSRVQLVLPGNVDSLIAGLEAASMSAVAPVRLSGVERTHWTWQAYASRYLAFIRARTT